VATFLTASVVPLTHLASIAMYGVPPELESYVVPYILGTSVPTYICAIIAIFGARVVYRLTQDLSRARHLGSYQLVERIGEGGMGEVWQARHTLLARPAAIKLIRPEVLGRDSTLARTALKRFEREAQLTTLLTHPHTITIYDYGRTPEGLFYYVMELLDGIDLETFVRRYGPAPAERVVHWMRQACGSLAEAHAYGLIHRDIKPANLYTCRYGLQTDFLKVLDFGLVKRDPGVASDETRMTQENTATGTPAYLPPEVALGREAETRSDLYALGCVAYWLLTGCTVFSGTTAMELAVQHAKDPPVPPSQRTELEIPPDLEAVVLTCLQKAPEDRPRDAADLARRLDACVLADAWTGDRSDTWWETHLPRVDADLPAAASPAG